MSGGRAAKAGTGERSAELCRVLTAVSGVPVTPGNHVDLLRNGDEIFPAMLEAIEQAERSIDLLTYVYWSGEIGGEFAQRLAQRAHDGLRVRVLLDGVGAKPIDADLVARMRSGGAEVRFFRPPDPRHPLRATHRTHRKVMICDEQVGFTGGVGIADEWLGDGRTAGAWRDTHVRLRGPAVAALRASFLGNWVETEPELFDRAFDHFPAHDRPGRSEIQVIKGTSNPGWNDVSMTVRSLVELAEDRVNITTAYFVPDEDLRLRLSRAAERGVDVRLLVPGPNADKRFVQLAGEACYRSLMASGVTIACYQPSMLHAKVMTFDGSVAVIGSANCNHRSTSLDEEVVLVIFDDDVTEQLDAHFDEDLQYSEELDLDRWEHRRPGQRVLERVMTLARAWM